MAPDELIVDSFAGGGGASLGIGNGVALIPARTETRMFYESVWPAATAVCFLRGRPHFHLPDGTRAPFNSGAPICLVAYGVANALSLQRSRLGVTVRLGWPCSSEVTDGT